MQHSPETTDTRTLLWFRRNLRVDDQPLIIDAREPVVGVWVLDPEEFDREDELGFPRCGDLRLQFVLECVADLRRSLRSRGSELYIRIGEPATQVLSLADQLDATHLRFVEEPGTDELAIEKRIARTASRDHAGLAIQSLPPESLFEIQDMRDHARHLPEVFSKWRRASEKHLEWAPPMEAPEALAAFRSGIDPGELPTLTDLGRQASTADPRAVMRFSGGEQAGVQRVQSWIFDHDHLRTYKETRNGLIGEAYSSKFSPWLAMGCLSPRRIAEQTLRYEEQRVASDSTYWLRFELLWREYFRLYLLKHGGSLFRAEGPQSVTLPWIHDEKLFLAWCEGRTGIDFIDANMRELSMTGFMSNRGRQNVASFLSKNLGIDWRWGARWFESQLLDYDPASNWGNWAYAAGVGADPRGFRGFNIQSQANRYDPDRRYVDLWLRDRRESIAPIVDCEKSLAAAERRWNQATS
jgi:deoxyribodipyrimidine photo-lyase